MIGVGAESLNAAAACSIILSEIQRQRQTIPSSLEKND